MASSSWVCTSYASPDRAPAVNAAPSRYSSARACGNGMFSAFVDGALGGRQGAVGRPEHVAQQRARALVQLPARHDLGDESLAPSLCRADPAPRQQQLQRSAPPNETGKQLRAACRREQAEVRFRQAQFHVVGRDPQVAAAGDFEARAQAVAVQRRDERFRDAEPQAPHITLPARLARDCLRGRRSELGEVRARAEATLAGPAHDDAAHVRVVPHRGEDLVEIVAHRGVVGVDRGGPV